MQYLTIPCRHRFAFGLKALTMITLISFATVSHAGTKRPPESHQSGVKPQENGLCSAEAPIKGNFTTHSGERCIYHMPGQRFCEKTIPERCYANEAEAIRDGCRKSKV